MGFACWSVKWFWNGRECILKHTWCISYLLTSMQITRHAKGMQKGSNKSLKWTCIGNCKVFYWHLGHRYQGFPWRGGPSPFLQAGLSGREAVSAAWLTLIFIFGEMNSLWREEWCLDVLATPPTFTSCHYSFNSSNPKGWFTNFIFWNAVKLRK